MSNEKVENLKQTLKEKGYKLTPQRRSILDEIIKNEGSHLTTEEIYDLVKVNCPEIGLATVYRTVQLLEEMGVVYKLDLDDGCSRYELCDDDENHQHHHLICQNCGKVIEVEVDLLEELEQVIEKKYNFNIKNHSLKFYGICDNCSLQ
ncbi:Fur family transcriptional regulator [Clostridium sp.]|uniref:Fur family transcriptional regulator n=1 Tax=Clostridium sp. TaxID=1506 RepID=UPI003216A568